VLRVDAWLLNPASRRKTSALSSQRIFERHQVNVHVEIRPHSTRFVYGPVFWFVRVVIDGTVFEVVKWARNRRRRGNPCATEQIADLLTASSST
jgi:hypothetical protein